MNIKPDYERMVRTFYELGDIKSLNYVLEKLFEKGKLYYHCPFCGVIFSDAEQTVPVFDLKLAFDDPLIPGRVFKGKRYSFTSNHCKPCGEKAYGNL